MIWALVVSSCMARCTPSYVVSYETRNQCISEIGERLKENSSSMKEGTLVCVPVAKSK